MNAVFIIPTGIGAEIGGHSGDATPAARLMASMCDQLIVHPNVVNAADINEMTPNMLYVEGSILDRFLEGEIGLEPVSQNRIVLAANPPVPASIINAASAARATLGAKVTVVELLHPLRMVADIGEHGACGTIGGMDELIAQMRKRGDDWDVLVINTPVDCSDDLVREYFGPGGDVNPWGGVEAMLSQALSKQLTRPVIHAPLDEDPSEAMQEAMTKAVDPRKAAEMNSTCNVFCCLKGAHRAPRMVRRPRGIAGSSPRALWAQDVDFLVTPARVVGRPHRACLDRGITVIAVAENMTILRDNMPREFLLVNNYIEAAGVLAAHRAGVSRESVRRPLKRTRVELADASKRRDNIGDGALPGEGRAGDVEAADGRAAQCNVCPTKPDCKSEIDGLTRCGRPAPSDG